MSKKINISVGGAVKPSSWTIKMISNVPSQLFREENTVQVGEEIKAPFELTTDIQPELRKVGDVTDDFQILEDGKVVLNKRTQINEDWTISARDSQVDMVGNPASVPKMTSSSNGKDIYIEDAVDGFVTNLNIYGRTINQLIPKIDLTEYNKEVEL